MSGSGLRFCMFTTFYPPYSFGGDGIFVQRLAKALLRRGHHVEVICNQDAYEVLAGRKRHDAPEEPFPVHRLSSRMPRWALLAVQQSGHPGPYGAAIGKILAQGSFDVLHFHNISLLGGPGPLDLGRAVKLYTAHEHWLICPTHTLWKFNREPCQSKACLACTLHRRRPPQLWRYLGWQGRMLRRLDALLCPSRFSLQRHRNEGLPVPMLRLPHFLPQTPLAPDDSEAPPYFLVVGRLERLKGIHTLLPWPETERAQLWIAGRGPEKVRLQKAARDQRVRFLGLQSQHRLQRLYRNALALIIPSLGYEAFGLVALEAFAQATPVIARKRGALTEVIEESGAGFLYTNPQELTQALQRLQSRPALRREKGEAGRRALKRLWSEERHLERYLGLIESIRAGQGPERD
ncbi:MAG: glycosyltransferase family 4 protein [Acidobacteriota bacterium]